MDHTSLWRSIFWSQNCLNKDSSPSIQKWGTVKTSQYDLSSLTNCDVRNNYTVTVRNKFNALKKKSKGHTPNDEYESFFTAHREAAAKCIPTKPRIKCRDPWESIAIREKWDSIKIASLLGIRNPTNANAPKPEKAKREVTHTKKNNYNTFKAKSIKSEIR